MEKSLYLMSLLGALSTLVACSASNESKQQAQDSFAHLQQKKQAMAIDIRPPTSPLAIIPNSVAQFDGEQALLIYPATESQIYNLKQIERLLKEQEIDFKAKDNQLETSWTASQRTDDVGDVKLRYRIAQINHKQATALSVSILQIKSDDILFTPGLKDKQRYTSDFLNQLVGKLNNAYQQQLQLQLLNGTN